MNHKITEEEKQKRKDRVLYIYFNLKEKNPKISIERFIKKQGITSESTARRIFTDAAHWKRGEIDLFLAIYNPIKSDSEAIKEVLGTEAGKVSSEVIEEPKNDDEQFEEEKSTECDIEAAHIINGLAAKYDSLYKVLLAAYNQASNGKGKERHQLNDDETFEKQKICEISRRLGSNDYNLGQAVKKIYESKRLPKERAIAELLGAINYIAAGIIILEESEE